MGEEKGIRTEMHVAIAMKGTTRCRPASSILVIANYSMQITITSVGMDMERNSNHLAAYLARMTASANFKLIFNLCSISNPCSSRTFTTPSFAPEQKYQYEGLIVLFTEITVTIHTFMKL